MTVIGYEGGMMQEIELTREGAHNLIAALSEIHIALAFAVSEAGERS